MAKPIEQIERDIAALEEAIANLRLEVHEAYSHYLNLLGQAVRQQLIMVSYHICTQGYPESFVSLPFAQRHKLQQALKQLCSEAQEQLRLALDAPETKTESEENPEAIFPLSREFPEDSNSPIAPTLGDLTLNLDSPSDSELSFELDSSLTPDTSDYSFELELPALNQDSFLLSPETSETEEEAPPLSSAEQLVQWQEQIEQAIAKILKTASRDANRLLQQNKILPQQLPEAVLEAAMRAKGAMEVTPGPPNLLNLLVERQTEDKLEDSTITPILAINLRLSEIEFADPTLTAKRSQLRHLSSKAMQLRRQDRKQQRELASAQAESAWRSSWFDE
jgi:hypothetical protein